MCVPLVVWLLQREGKLLEILLNPKMSPLEESITLAKLVKKVVDPMDVHLAQTLGSQGRAADGTASKLQ